MGTALTGLEIRDTYDALIKVTDNGPLSGSLKTLTDGLGNDSALALSTGAASITGTLAVSGTSTFSSALTAATGSNFTGTSTNSRIIVTAAGVANTILGFNNSGSTVNGVVNNAGYIGILQDYPLVVTIADAEKMRITGAGNVGIGTSSPNYSLQVNSSTTTTRLQITNSTTGTSSTNGLQFIQDGNDTTISLKPSGFMSFETANNERLRITSAGNVGIGTSSPMGKLDVTKAGKDTIVVLDTTPFAAGVGGSIDLGGTYRTAGDLGAFTRIAAEKSNATDQNYSYDLGFYVTTNGGATLGTKVATMTSTGNLGIGTSSPTQKLHVYEASVSSQAYLLVENNRTRNAAVYTKTTAGGFYAGTSIGTDTLCYQIYDDVAGERMRITSTGNVGIGTSSPDNVLDLGSPSQGRGLTFDNYSNIFSSYSAGDLVLSSNFYGNTASDSYLTSTTATFGAAGIRISATSGASTGGQIQFFANAAASKTAGAAFTPTEICRVTPNGLTFNGDTAAANALDDYEEGTWTPTVGGTSGTATYTTQFGSYTKIGRQVTVNWFVAFQKNTLSGNVSLSGLPFALGNFSSLNYPQAIIMLDNLASAYTNPLLQLANGATTANIITNNGSTTSHAAMDATQLGAATMDFRGTATYFV